jgi:uncharacterized protein (DUF58 family)
VLTRQGWAILVGAVTTVIAARLFGIIELYIVGAALAAMAVAAWCYVRLTRPRLRVRRTLNPARVHAGDSARVEVTATNVGKGRTPVLALRDPVAGTRGARLHLVPLRHAERARAAYRLPTDRRGVVAVGPLTIEVADPFGLAVHRRQGAPRIELTVFPHVDVIAPPPGGGDRDPLGTVTNHRSLGRLGDEFYALREYVVGDDLRRVHWRSTARYDDLMVRQDEMPWQDRTTVVLDIRRASHSEESLERAVSAAASVVTAAYRAQHHLRLVASDGTDAGLGNSIGHVEAIMEYLAMVDTTGHGSLRAVLQGMRRSPQAGSLVVVLGRATKSEIDALARLRRSFGAVVTVVTEGRDAPAVGALPVTIVDARADGQFARSWAALVGQGTTARQAAFEPSVGAQR